MSNRLFWQQVGLSGGGSAQALSAAAQLTANAGQGIGLELTRWGERREKRLQDKKDQADLAALEQIDMLLSGANTQEDLAGIRNVLAERGQLPTGAADLISGRETEISNLLTDAANVRSVDARTRNTVLDGDKRATENEIFTRGDDFQNVAAEDIGSILDVASTGNRAELNQTIDGFRDKYSSQYGASLVEGAIENALSDFDTETGRRNTITDRARRTEREDITNARRDAEYGRGEEDRLRTERLDDIFDGLRQTEPSAQDAQVAIQDLGLNAEDTNDLLDRVSAGELNLASSQPSITTAESLVNDEVQRAANTVGALFGQNVRNLNPAAVSSEISANIEERNRDYPGFSVWNESRRMRNSGETITDVRAHLEEAFPSYDWTKKGSFGSGVLAGSRGSVAANYGSGLDPYERVALAQQALGENPKNFKATFRALVDDYQAANKGGFVAEATLRDQIEQQASGLTTQISIQEARRRRAGPGTPEFVDATRQIDILKKQMSDLNSQVRPTQEE